MGCARRAEPGFSPLDEELGLGSGSLTPALFEHVVRLGASLPFARASREVEAFRRVSVSLSTVRRHTLRAGAASEEGIEREVERLEREAPEPPGGPEKLTLSVDGAMVPLRGGEWAEVKTLALGAVEGEGPDGSVRTGDWSYFSRLADAETFGRLALWETERRGLARARQVAAVTDGAEWIQGFIDYHRPDALRILDFPHAAQRVSDLCEVVGDGADALAVRLRRLREEGPQAELSGWRDTFGAEERWREAMREPLLYLEKREPLLQYPQFRRDGWPIGSGSVESANKLVVEARLKGSGMHWKRENVNPMLALRNALCSHRWDDAWREVVRTLREQQARERNQKRQARSALTPLGIPPSPPASETLTPPSSSPPLSKTAPKRPSPHPWRQFRGPSTSYFSSHAKT